MKGFRLVVLLFLASVGSKYVVGQSQPQAFGVCKPVSERTQELGCWILGEQQVGKLEQPQAFWQIDTYSTRPEAEAAKGAHSAVFEAIGKVWLLTVERKGWQPAKAGQRVAEIGPIPVVPGKEYSALFMEGSFSPGMNSMVHTHSGPEAWYVVQGEQCLETPSGKMVGRAGGPPVIVPAGPPMMLTGIGAGERRALTLILHPSSELPTQMENHWKPKGLCKASSE